MHSRSLSRLSSFSTVAEQFRQSKTTPREYLESCIEAIERCEPTIKAFVCTDLMNARTLADLSTTRYRDGHPLSPIDGMPVGIKDIIATVDMPTRMNSAVYEGFHPKIDAAAVRAICQGGGIPLGKTVTTEFAIGRSGPTVNPHNAGHTPGGSSSGSAAGAAVGMFPAGLGTQTQGSLIRPASFCGVVGYKPSWGALSTDGIHPLSPSQDHLGVLAESVDAAWWVARWVSECVPSHDHFGLSGPLNGSPPGRVPGRVAVLRTTGYKEVDHESIAAFEGMLEQLRMRDIQVIEPHEDPLLATLAARLDSVPAMSQEMMCYEMRWPYMGYLASNPAQVGPRIHALMDQAREISRDRYRELLRYRYELVRLMAALSDSFDALVLPASSGPAPKGLEHTGSRTLLVYSSFLGIPAYSVPVMEVGAMPFGLQLLGFVDGDYRLTRHAQWVTRVFGPGSGRKDY